MLSQTADYAMSAIVYLAEHPGQPSTIQQIAGSIKVPAGYLSKVMQTLARRGMVNSQRGQGGGFVLARSPEELSLYEIVQAVDPIRRFTTCPRDNEAHKFQRCVLHRRLDEVAASYEAALRSTSVADLLAMQNSCPAQVTFSAKP